MEKCWRCGHELICSGNFMISDYGEELDENDDAMITNYVCPNCGASYEVTDTPVNDRIHYPYWSDENNI